MGSIRLELRRNTNSTSEPSLLGEYWPFSEPCALSGIVDLFEFIVSGILLEVWCEENTFSPDSEGLMLLRT